MIGDLTHLGYQFLELYLLKRIQIGLEDLDNDLLLYVVASTFVAVNSENQGLDVIRLLKESFNLPDHTGDLEIIRTRLGQTFYQQCYSQRGDQYYHDLQRFPIDDAADSDQAVVFDGHVSATRIDLSEIGQNPDS